MGQLSASKGPRRYVASRLPVDLHAEVLDRAQRAGLSVSEYVAAQLAEACAHPPAEPAPTNEAAA